MGQSQSNFGDLPPELVKKLPHRQGLGTRLLAQALADCHAAGETFAFVAIILDCVDEAAKAFYQRWDLREMPGRPMRLFLPFSALAKLMSAEDG